MRLLLGLDLGTTAVKAGVFDEQGTLLSLGCAAYDLLTPGPGLVELPGSEYWRAVTSAVREALASPDVSAREVAAVGICSQGETFVPIDEQGRELRDFIVWLDARATEDARDLESRFDRARFYRTTGLPGMDPAFDLPKLLWMKRHEPRILDRTWKILHLPDYITYRLTGELAANESVCSTTGYVDIVARDWWDEALSEVGLSRQILAPLRHSGEVVGALSASGARETGLMPGTPVITGPIDQASGALGAGNVAPGMLTETTGGALATVSTTDQPVYDSEMRVPVGIHAVPGKYTILTYSPTGGMVLKWLSGILGVGDYGALVAEASEVPPGSDGVILLPHLAGMVVPRVNPDARGALLGLSMSHRPAHLARAALESVAFMLREHVDLVEEMGVPVGTVRSLGGGAKSDLWLQIKADVLNRPVETIACPEAACLGAALLAGTAVGVWSSAAEAAGDVVRVGRGFEPSPENSARYQACYERYLRMSRIAV